MSSSSVDSKNLRVSTQQRFLDSHFTTLESLELIDDIIGSQTHTQQQLKDDLDQTSQTTKTLAVEAESVSQQVHKRALELIDLHSEVVGDTADESVSAWQFRDGTEIMDLVAKLADETESYKRLKQTKQYVEVLVDISRQSKLTEQCLGKSNYQGALSAYKDALEILSKHGTSGNGANLTQHMRQTVRNIWSAIDKAGSSAQSESLRALGWPGTLDMSNKSAIVAFGSSFSLLTSLDSLARDFTTVLSDNGIALRSGSTTSLPSPLPLEHMARAVDIRMRYHFEGVRQTNRVDKPEWWLSLVLSMLRSIVPFLETHVQQIYDRTVELPLDVRNEFIRLVLPMVHRKLANDRGAYIEDGMVVSQLVKELADFEQILQTVYFYNGECLLDSFLTHDIDLFAAWVEAERVHGTESYMQGIKDPGAFEMAYEQDVLDIDDARPTRIAEKVVLVIEGVSERCAWIPGCMQRLQMVNTVQFPIIIALVEDIEEEIDEYSRISLAFMRDAGITGASTSASAASTAVSSPLVPQLTRLASWYQTIWYVEEAAQDWNNASLFVDMWAAVVRHAKMSSTEDDPRDWRDGCDEWDGDDRKLLDNDGNVDVDVDVDESWLDGGIWERSVNTLSDLKDNVLGLISRGISKDLAGQMRPYRKKDNWCVREEDDHTGISAELAGVLPEYANIMSTLATLLPSSACLRISKQVAKEIDSFLVDRVCCAHLFNVVGGRQFSRDVDAISKVLYRAISPATSQKTHSVSMGKRSLSLLLPRAMECATILSCCVDDGYQSEETGDSLLPLSQWGTVVTDAGADSHEVALLLKKLGITRLTPKEVGILVGNRVDYTVDFSK